MKNPMKDLSSPFGQRIKYLRESRNESLQDVATAIGCSKAHIWEMEQGSSCNPTLNTIRCLAIHFMVPAAALVENLMTYQYRKTDDR